MKIISTRILFFHVVMILQLPGFAQQPPQLEVVPQTGHHGPVSVVQISHDGEYFVTLSYDQTILWETASGRQVRNFGNANAVAISGNGKVLATGHATIDLWDVVSGVKLGTISPDPTDRNPEYMPRVKKVILSEDGKYVAALKYSRSEISVWETASGRILRTLDVGANPGQEVPPLVLSSDGKLTLAGGGKIDTFRRKRSRSSSTCSAVSADEKVVAVGYADGMTNLWSTVEDRQLHSLDAFRNRASNPQVTSVALSGDGQVLLTGNIWGMVIVWNAASGKKLHTIPPDPGCSVIGLSGDGKSMCTATNDFIQTSYPDSNSPMAPDNTVRLWDLASGTSPFAFSTDAAHGVEPENKDLEGDEVARVHSCGPRAAVMWLHSSNRLPEFPAGSFAISSDGTHLATALPEQAADLWDLRSGKKIRTFGREDEWAHGLALSADAGLLAAAGLSSTSLWDTVTGRKLRSVEGGFHCLALTPDGKRLYTSAINNREVHLWDTANGQIIRTFKPGPLTSIILSSNGQHFVTGSDRGNETASTLWDVATGKQLQTVPGLPIAVSPDGKQLWTLLGGLSKTSSCLWDLTKGRELCRLYSFDLGREWLVVTPEGLVDGSEGAWRHVVFRVPGTLKVLDDKATFQKFHRPGLLARLWNLEPFRNYVETTAVEMPPVQTAEEIRHKRMRTFAESHEVVVVDSSEKADLIEEPIFSWDTPNGKTLGGALHLWTLKGRPVATISLWTHKDIRDSFEYQSLHEGALKVRSAPGLDWNPETPGIHFRPLADSDPPSDDKPMRLMQMQKIAKDRFLPIMTAFGRKIRLELVPAPIYRYGEFPDGVLDGGIFSYTWNNDPECLLLLEARVVDNEPQWYYAFGSQTSRRVDGKLDGVNVWSNASRGDSFRIHNYPNQ